MPPAYQADLPHDKGASSSPTVSLKAFLMRLILAGNLSQAGLIAYLQQRRTQVAAHQHAIEQTAQMMDEGMDLGERLALDYGLAVAGAELAWLDSTLEQLSQMKQ